MTNNFINNYFVWSSGLEKWEPINLSETEQKQLIKLHVKKLHGIPIVIFQDKLGRFILYQGL